MPKTVEEQKEYRRAYRKANREKINAYARDYSKANREKINSYHRRYYEKNRKTIREYQQKYEQLHPEVSNRIQFKQLLKKRIIDARESLRIHQKEKGMDGCDICVIRQSKIDCLERLYEENFITKHDEIVVPNCPVVLAKKIIKY